MPCHANILTTKRFNRGGPHVAARHAEHAELSRSTDWIATQWQDFLLLAGRVLMGWIFISSGWRKLMDIPGFVKTGAGRYALDRVLARR